eukprot:1161548-Pelagomonas_calceolata.AAC.7
MEGRIQQHQEDCCVHFIHYPPTSANNDLLKSAKSGAPTSGNKKASKLANGDFTNDSLVIWSISFSFRPAAHPLLLSFMATWVDLSQCGPPGMGRGASKTEWSNQKQGATVLFDNQPGLPLCQPARQCGWWSEMDLAYVSQQIQALFVQLRALFAPYFPDREQAAEWQQPHSKRFIIITSSSPLPPYHHSITVDII